MTEFGMASDSETGGILLFGGCLAGNYTATEGCASPSDQTWQFGNETWTQLSPKDSPPARYFGMMADDPALGGVVLFGGENQTTRFNDTWLFAGGNWENITPTSSPPPIDQAAFAWDPTDREDVLFGGSTPGALSGSYGTWVFHGGAWTNVTTAFHPPGWIAPTMAASPSGGLVLSGGISALFFPTYYQQTWSFEAGAWTNLTSGQGNGPPSSVLYALSTFDPTRNETLVFGGGDSTDIPKATEGFTVAGNWTQVVDPSADRAGAFYQTGAAYDPGDQLTVEFGTERISQYYGIPEIGTTNNSSWVLLNSLEVAPITVGGTLSPGNNLTFGATISGGLPPYEVEWRFGDNASGSGDPSTHAYGRAGEFDVNLTVRDRVGEAVNLTDVVNVTASPSTSGGLLGSVLNEEILVGVVGAVLVAVVVALFIRRSRRKTPPSS